ncbi:TPA: hypothetical protein I7730_00935 [Vibrio vulnificus]|uniref:Uncharacterized protein n=1 Tax=Vibrio vulnificus TaxID=672 RepID=A0A8H9MYP9_VIBVL|nr:hypothetical protein [Vibrio vulnificus]
MLFDMKDLDSILNTDVSLKRVDFNSKSTLLELMYGVRGIMCEEDLSEFLRIIIDHTKSVIVDASVAGKNYLIAYENSLNRLTKTISKCTTDASRRAAAKRCELDIENAKKELSGDVGKGISSMILSLMDVELIKLHLRDCATDALHSVLLKIINTSETKKGARFKLVTSGTGSLRLSSTTGVDLELLLNQSSTKVVSAKIVYI